MNGETHQVECRVEAIINGEHCTATRRIGLEVLATSRMSLGEYARDEMVVAMVRDRMRRDGMLVSFRLLRYENPCAKILAEMKRCKDAGRRFVYEGRGFQHEGGA